MSAIETEVGRTLRDAVMYTLRQIDKESLLVTSFWANGLNQRGSTCRRTLSVSSRGFASRDGALHFTA